ncbi:MAG TPA: TetR/AcrR family transcriptional regulator [Opitutaceae bacterium]|nr:TetR/AcrR family transcriptional regulator [Opitutaceae bacterium]
MPVKDIRKPIRKKPTQRRSEETVEAILEAAARVFVSDGLDGTTTKIAEIAGVSVGSFYQYFPDKHSLLLELRERHYAALMTQAQKIGEEMADEPFERALNRILRFVFDHETAQRNLQRIFMKELPLVPSNDWSTIMNTTIQAGLRELFILHRDELHSADLELSIFAVSASIRGAARALIRDDPKFTNESLADELTRMITGHLVVVR